MGILPLAAELDYRTIAKYLRLPRPTGATLTWMLLAVLCAILLFVLYELITRTVRRATEKRRSEEDFEQLTLVCALTPEEIRLLRHLIGICGVKYPDRILTSFEFFNQCLEEKGPASKGPITAAIAERLKTVRNKIFFGERSRLMPIRSTRELAPNQRLHLKRVSTGEIYMAPVVDTGPSGLLITTPRVNNGYVEVRPGERIEVYFWRERDAGYTFATNVVGQTGTRYLITILEHVDDIERTQRRRYHRVAVLIPVTATPVMRDDLDKISRGEQIDIDKYPSLQAYVVDISGTGFAFASRTTLRADDLVHIEIEPEKGASKIPIIGKVLNVTRKESTGEYLMHAEIVGLRADTHEKILEFVYAQSKRGVSGIV
jgi:c-di-GMP-binding flagellar brake protein YcgR